MKLIPNETFGAESEALNENVGGTALLNADASVEDFAEPKPKAGLAGVCVVASDLAEMLAEKSINTIEKL